MYSGDTVLDRSKFTRYFPQGDVTQEASDLLAQKTLIEEEDEGDYENEIKQAPHTPIDRDLDLDQRLSAALAGNSSYNAPPSASPRPFPVSVSETSNLSSSPAALFLSSFASPTPKPAPLPDDHGEVVAGYALDSIIAYGSFSTIRMAFSASGGVVAVKIVRRNDLVRAGNAPLARKRLQHEAAVWSALSHEHILPLFSAVHTSYADYFFTLYCPAGSLYDILKRDGRPALPQDDAGMMFRQVVRGLRYLHEDAMFVHRDMKLENVLVDESGVCRIGDFGLSKKIGELDGEDELQGDQFEHHNDAIQASYSSVQRAASLSVTASKKLSRLGSHLNPAITRHNSARHRNTTAQPSHSCQPGSLPYAAPELLLPQMSDTISPHPCQDIWALGVMLYALLTGHLPFNDSFEPRLQMKILNGVYEVPKDIGRGAERILKGCLERSIPDRWTVTMVDEVAWGVGWGSAGDDATPGDSDDEICNNPRQSSRTQARSRPLDIVIPDDADWQQEEPMSRSALEAASRRSTSRAKRSSSRAPILTRNSTGQSMSRHSRASSPTRTPYNILHGAIGSASHSPITSPYDETSAARTHSSSRERGRKPNKSSHFCSRSPSPSVVPTTPVDFGLQLITHMEVHDQQEDLELDSPPRGRTKFVSPFQPGRQEDTYATVGEDKVAHSDTSPTEWSSAVLDAYAIRERGETSSSPERSVDRRQHMSSPYDTIRRPRPGSNPSESATSWELQKSRPTQNFPSRRQSQDLLLSSFPATPTGNISITRSRSADFERHVTLNSSPMSNDRSR